MGTTTTTRRNTNTNKNTRLHSKLDPKRSKRMSRSGKMIVEIETLPFPEGNSRNKYHNVEEAISIVEKSGLKYEVSPLCTTLEGSPDEVWSVLRRRQHREPDEEVQRTDQAHGHVACAQQARQQPA